MTGSAYVRTVQNQYLALPNTSNRFSCSDRHLARHLYLRGIPISVVRSALLLATVRRLCRHPHATPLPPVRSLYYFLPVIEEILLAPLPPSYLPYLEHKIAGHK
jgi:hypothetical protein